MPVANVAKPLDGKIYLHREEPPYTLIPYSDWVIEVHPAAFMAGTDTDGKIYLCDWCHRRHLVLSGKKPSSSSGTSQR